MIKNIILTSMMTLLFQKAWAGKCMEPTDLQNFRSRPYIFEAKLISDKKQNYFFVVSRSFKGKTLKRIAVSNEIGVTDYNKASRYKTNKKYLVIIHFSHPEQLSRIQLTVCDKVIPVKEAQDYLKMLSQ